MVSTMANRAQTERDGGHEFHVADSYIWAEIYYLDSATDYSHEMVLLDNETRPSLFRSLGKFFIYCSIITAVVLLVVAIIKD